MVNASDVQKYFEKNFKKIHISRKKDAIKIRLDNHLNTSYIELYARMSDKDIAESISKMNPIQKFLYYGTEASATEVLGKTDFELGPASLGFSYILNDNKLEVPGTPECVKEELKKNGFDYEIYSYHGNSLTIYQSINSDSIIKNMEILKEISFKIDEAYRIPALATREIFRNAKK